MASDCTINRVNKIADTINCENKSLQKNFFRGYLDFILRK